MARTLVEWPFRSNRRRVMSAQGSGANLIIVAEDVSFADVFSRQIIALGKAGDVSTSERQSAPAWFRPKAHAPPTTTSGGCRRSLSVRRQ
jgi:hypothetical protein